MQRARQDLEMLKRRTSDFEHRFVASKLCAEARLRLEAVDREVAGCEEACVWPVDDARPGWV